VAAVAWDANLAGLNMQPGKRTEMTRSINSQLNLVLKFLTWIQKDLTYPETLNIMKQVTIEYGLRRLPTLTIGY